MQEQTTQNTMGHLPVNYMVAIDDSPSSACALEELKKMMNVEKDVLYILTVADQIPMYGPVVSALIISEAQKSAELKAEMLLADYVQKCRIAGIKNFRTLLGRGGHIGEVICRAAESKNIHLLVVGRRGMGKIKRLFIGSTSRYCVEHAPCSVACIKLPASHDDDSIMKHTPVHESQAHKDKTTLAPTTTTAHELFYVPE